MNTARQSTAGREDAIQLGDMVLGMAESEPFEDHRGWHLAEPGVQTDRSSFGLAERAETPRPVAQARVHPVEQHPQRQRPIALDAAEPQRIVRHAPEGGRSWRAVDHSLELAQPERQHLGDMGEDLARPPRGLRACPEVGREVPWFAGSDPRSEGSVRSPGVGESVQIGRDGRHGRQCRMRGVRWRH